MPTDRDTLSERSNRVANPTRPVADDDQTRPRDASITRARKTATTGSAQHQPVLPGRKTSSKMASKSMGPPDTPLKRKVLAPTGGFPSGSSIDTRNPPQRRPPAQPPYVSSIPSSAFPSPTSPQRSRTTSHKSISTNSSVLHTYSAMAGKSPMTMRMTPIIQDSLPVKSTAPYWHLDEPVYDARPIRRPNKRVRGDDVIPPGLDVVKRVSIAPVSRRNAFGVTIGQNRQNTPNATLGPNFKLIVNGDSRDANVEEDLPRYLPRAKIVDPIYSSSNHSPTHTSRKLQIGAKAARKREAVHIQESEESSSDGSSRSSPSGISDEEEVDQLISDTENPGSGDEEEQEHEAPPISRSRRSYSPPAVEILDAPRISAHPLQLPPLLTPSPELTPSDDLVAALETLALSSIRMQSTKQLPFLLRNLRRGFQARCRVLNIPTTNTHEAFTVHVLYKYVAINSTKHLYETKATDWLCPLCELHGSFPTRQMLASHLDWDHQEVDVEWEKVDDAEGVWRLHLLILETQVPRHEAPVTFERLESAVAARPFSSPFPSVSLSPPREPTLSSASTSATPLPPKLKSHEPTIAPAPSSSTRLTSQFTSQTRSSSATTTTVTRKRSLPARYPTPPPASDPLGPAARAPLLPAKSEYGGPDIYYSCRPGGPRLYDLLNTLPMEPFGVLAWAITDREEEIFESDEMRDEYKVMHALWARWIMLNRREFIADYYKGVVTFVDEYWKMIHRAAGWGALRYWLLILLANRFISGHDVANVLKHYESLTGMEYWYD